MSVDMGKEWEKSYLGCVGIKPTGGTPVPAQIPLARRDPREAHVCVAALFTDVALVIFKYEVGMVLKRADY